METTRARLQSPTTAVHLSKIVGSLLVPPSHRARLDKSTAFHIHGDWFGGTSNKQELAQFIVEIKSSHQKAAQQKVQIHLRRGV